jgi:uncharacterized protein
MIDHLPERLDLLAAAEAGRLLQGSLPLTRLERVLPALRSPNGELQVQLELGKDPDGTRFLAGSIRGTVELQCQRCLDSMELPLNLDFRLGMVQDHAGGRSLHERYEPLVVGSEPMLVADIVSDEVLLALPLVPTHADDGKCQEFVKDYQPPQRAKAKRENPFAMLAELKQKPQ